MVVHDGPGKGSIEDLLRSGRAPFEVAADPVIFRGEVIREVAQGRLVRQIEPASDACKVAVPGCVRQVVGQRPDPLQNWNEMGMRIRESVYVDSGWRRYGEVQHSRIEIKNRLKEICVWLCC